MLKEDILKELAHNRARSLSGQALADTFGVSRNAVWKAVKALEGEGIEIEAGTNKGYRLAPQVLTRFDVDVPADIKVFFYESIDSTNTQAKRLLAAGEQGKILLVANEQTAGRGRCGRSFYSPKQTGLYFSYVFHPGASVSDTVWITTAAAVAVMRAIERLTPLKPAVKWVNDIYIGEKKVCGILTEAVSDFESGTVESVVIGIGINVNTADFPEEISERAASLNDSALTRAALLNAVLKELLIICAQKDNEEVLKEYKAHSLVLGKQISFTRGGETYEATAVDIDEQGGLVVRTAQGEQTLNSGEISVFF
ncbi:MAG: biotin--[Clostridia bacterium]|nr:biotin--[acetyl-CoA-carboxylase] ligase [Clostridia bacterium]